MNPFAKTSRSTRSVSSRCDESEHNFSAVIFVCVIYASIGQRKPVGLSRSADTAAFGNKGDSDPFECPNFLKQKRILMIGDSIDRRVLES